MNKSFVLLLPAVLALGLTGCSRQGNYTDTSAINNYAAHRGDAAQDTTRAYQTQQLYGTVVHDNNHLYYNQNLSDQISAMYGVQTAIVMTTDKYAYVAVLFDQSGIGTHGEEPSEQTNNAGTVRGLYNTYDPYNDGADPNSIANGVNGYYTVKDHNNISHGVKQKIAQKIRYLQPNLLDVFISANRDYVNAFTRLAKESWKGNSLQPHVADFNQLVTRVFGNKQWSMNE